MASITPFSRRILGLRKAKGWSQPELGKRLDTSGAIIGRYERGEMTPSIEVATKLAQAFGVTLDYLVAEQDRPNVLQDTAMLERWQAIEALKPEDRERILYVIDGLIRDAQARKAYQATG